MNFLKRSILNILRKPSKSLLLFFIVLLLGNLICSSYAITQSTNNVKNNIEQQLGALVTIHANSKMNSEKNDYIISNENEIYRKHIDIVDVFKSITDNNIVKYSDYMYAYNVFESRNIVDSDSNLNYSENENIDPLTKLEILAVNQSNFSDIKDNRIKIISGRSFSNEEILNGEHVIILNEKYKGVNDACELVTYEKILSLDEEYYVCNRKEKNLEVGDTIHLVRQIYVNQSEFDIGYPSSRNVYYEDSIEYEIIGFYENVEEIRNNTFLPSYILLNGDRVTSYSSTMNSSGYIPDTALLNDIKNFQQYADLYYENNNEIIKTNNFSLVSLAIELSDPKRLDEYVNEIELEYRNDGFYDLEYKSSKDTYDLVAGSITSLSTISKIVLFVSVVISIIILTLVIIMFLKDRRYEIGIYISLGEKKWKIITQIFLEICLISIVALNLSLITGNKLGGIITDKILETSISNDSEESINSQIGSVNPNNLNVGEVKEQIVFIIDSRYIISLNSIGLFIISFSTIAPIMYILRLNPKKILM